jgi:hypothetical protein
MDRAAARPTRRRRPGRHGGFQQRAYHLAPSSPPRNGSARKIGQRGIGAGSRVAAKPIATTHAGLPSRTRPTTPYAEPSTIEVWKSPRVYLKAHSSGAFTRQPRKTQAENREAKACAAHLVVLRHEHETCRRQVERRLAEMPPSPTQADAMRLLDPLFASSSFDNKLIAAVIDKLADRNHVDDHHRGPLARSSAARVRGPAERH